jgi:hypothetical protein
MLRLPQRPLFLSVLFLLWCAFAGEIRMIFSGHRAAGRAQARLKLELRALKQQEAVAPAPTEENAVAIEADLARAGQILVALRAGLTAPGGTRIPWENLPVPPKRTDAFFDLASFVEQARDRAAKSGVALKPDERFGFSAYAAEGPVAELIPTVFHQRLAAQYVLEALFDACPRRLVSMQREAPSFPAEPAAASHRRPQPPPADRLVPDLFVIDPRLSVRVSGMVETVALRVVFVGSTATLRAFLAKLAGSDRPTAVRCVEVEPAAGPDAVPTELAGASPKSIVLTAEPSGRAADSPLPVVVPALSKFTVTVELIELTSEDSPPPFKDRIDPAA